MNKNEENTMIEETLIFLEKGKFKDRKPYLKDFLNEGVEIKGYIFRKDGWSYIIEKPTDIGNNPEYKGEPLIKIVPTTNDLRKTHTVLNAQPWVYV